MRILQGRHAGRHLTSPGRRVRPTPEEVRGRALDLVASELPNARFLDLFAGSGAVGLEALSRGAATVDFVESGAPALHALKANVAALKETRRTRIFKRDVIPWITRLETGSYDIAFLDPPYGSRKLDRVVDAWVDEPFSGILVVEHSKEHTLGARGKRYDFEGPTRLTILKA